MARRIDEGNVRPNSADDVINFKFSPEDMRVLQECGNESFYKRSLPISGFLGFGTYFAIKAGYLKPSIRYGPVPKVVSALFIGYVLGKVSYRQICADRLMQMPNSEIGRMLRKKANISERDFGSMTYDKPVMSLPMESDPVKQNTNSSLNLDMDRPAVALEDSFQSPSDGGYKPNNDLMIPLSPALTYDDMRKQNRDDHVARRSQPYKVDETVKPIKTQTERETRNQYGDVIN